MASLEFGKEADALYLRLKEGKVSSSEPLADNMVADLDSKKKVLGIGLILPPTVRKETKAQLVRTKH